MFSNDRPSLPVMPALPPALPLGADSQRGVKQRASTLGLQISVSVSAKCILCKADIPYEHRRRATLQRSVRKLQIFISCSSGCQGLPSFLQGGTGEQLCESLEACMGLKSCFTVEKRANSLLVYMRWFQSHPALPEFLTEESVWNFFSQLKREGAPKSKCGGVYNSS
eukprot:s10433_g1.t1